MKSAYFICYTSLAYFSHFLREFCLPIVKMILYAYLYFKPNYLVVILYNFCIYSKYLCKIWTLDNFFLSEKCDNIKDLNILTTCLRNIGQVLISRHLEVYCEKVELLFNKLGDSNPKLILKIVSFLIHYYPAHNINLIRKLLLLLQGNVSKMETWDIFKLNQVF